MLLLKISFHNWLSPFYAFTLERGHKIILRFEIPLDEMDYTIVNVYSRKNMVLQAVSQMMDCISFAKSKGHLSKSINCLCETIPEYASHIRKEKIKKLNLK